MQLATWNVNSIRTRLERLVPWLERHRPDVLCLQETKVADEQFPRAELEALGYHLAVTGEKGRNGVALLSLAPMTDVVTALPGGADDAQARFVSATTLGARVLCVYVPNGQGVGTEAFFYKLDWLSRLLAHLRDAHDPKAPLALAGDFNICPGDLDVFEPELFRGRLHCTDHERRAVQWLLQWGLEDALRKLEPTTPGRFTWFDYSPRTLKRGEGLRIDLVLLTAPLAARLERVEIDLEERAGKRPSDHCPVVVHLRP